ncbi:MAG: YncE family protein [Archangium sp.]
MRPLFLSSLALLVVACTKPQPRTAPSDRFIYPSGIAYRTVSGSTNGILYVSSANFDRCFDQGTLMAVDLDRVRSGTDGALSPLGTPPPIPPSKPEEKPAFEFTQLNLAPESLVYIQSYAGEMALWNRPDAPPRLFVPARADGDYVHYIDLPEPTRLSCVGTSSNNCIEGALSLDQVADKNTDLPRAPSPFGVSISSGEVWVTHLNAADSPAESKTNFQTYVVRLPGDTPSVSTEDFLSLSVADLPMGGGNSVVADERYVFVTGRFDLNLTTTTAARRFLVRVLDKNNPGRLVDPGLDLTFAALEARGIALTSADPSAPARPRRLYMAVRSPDSLLSLDVQGIEATSDSPSLSVVGAVPLPSGPTEVLLLPRGPARSELVLVSCSTAGVVAIYDPDVGQVVAQVSVRWDFEESGTQLSTPQPFGLAVQQQDNAARIFASNFGDGRISVIDIPDLDNPQVAKLVAHIGARQDQEGSACREIQQ